MLEAESTKEEEEFEAEVDRITSLTLSPEAAIRATLPMYQAPQEEMAEAEDEAGDAGDFQGSLHQE